jgi:phage baseplate assembly protein W
MAELNGLSFPLRFSSLGSLATTKGVDKVKENIHAIVLTCVGERVMNPNVGTLARNQIFRNIDEDMLSTLTHHLRTGIEAGDQRVIVLDVNIERTDKDGKLLVDVMFKLDSQSEYDNVVVYL